MKEKKLKELLIAAKKDLGETYVILYNDGEKRETLEKDVSDKLKNINDQFFWIRTQFEDSCDYYGRRNDFDKINMGLKVGVLYKKKDINEEGSIIEGAKPISDMVHFYTGDFETYKDDVKTSKYNFADAHYKGQGFIKYDELVSNCEEEDISYSGPATFGEFVYRVAKNKEKFPIDLSISLVEDNSLKLK